MICKRCGGAGNLFRPISEIRNGKKVIVKLLNWNRCTNCGGWGTKPAPIGHLATIPATRARAQEG